LREATDRYLEDNAGARKESVRQQIRPISEAAIKALTTVLIGPQQLVYQVPDSAGKSSYRIEVEGSDMSCNCKGFTYPGMCRHVRDLKQAMVADGKIPDQYRLLD
jgi:hypothetical protein